MTAHQIRRSLAKRSGSLFFSPAERALLAVLELPEYRTLEESRINADHTRGAQVERKRVNRVIEAAWDGAA